MNKSDIFYCVMEIKLDAKMTTQFVLFQADSLFDTLHTLSEHKARTQTALNLTCTVGVITSGRKRPLVRDGHLCVHLTMPSIYPLVTAPISHGHTWASDSSPLYFLFPDFHTAVSRQPALFHATPADEPSNLELVNTTLI